jgi:hypothetical protein
MILKISSSLEFTLRSGQKICPLFKFCCRPKGKIFYFLPALSRYRVPYLIFRVGDADLKSEVGIRIEI